MRIVSLLPSATEIVFALGLEDQLVAVTHECDWPPPARQVQQVTRSLIPVGATASEIDELVTASMTGGPATYELDAAAVRELAPDLVLTQDLCAVCAVPAGDVERALLGLGCPADVVSLDPSSLGEVFDGVRAVAVATARQQQAEAFLARLQGRLATVAAAVRGRPRPKVFALEWGDPPFNGGHWVPEMIDRAGGEGVLGSRGTPSVRVTWDAIRAAAPDVVVFMPCGYDVARSAKEGRELLERPELADVGVVVAVDGSSYFSRPGPRLVDGVEILAAALHPDAVPSPTSEQMVWLRSPAGVA